MTEKGERVLVFDGSCGFCSWGVKRVLRLDRYGSVTAAPYQNAAIRQRLELELDECRREVWLIGPDDRRLAGGRACWTLWFELVGLPGWAKLGSWWGFRHLIEIAYRIIAANRHRLPGIRPYCRKHPEVCDSD